MSALGSHGVGLSPNLDEQYLPILNAIKLHLQFLAVLQITFCQSFNLVLFRHDSNRGTEAERRTSLKW